MDASTVLNILLLCWFFVGALMTIFFNGLAIRKSKNLNDRLCELGEPVRNWMNPINVFQLRNEIQIIAPREFKALKNVFIGWAITCMILLLWIQTIFFLASLFV